MFNTFYGTGDTHGCNGVLHRLNTRNFSADEDTVIFIAGDFGCVWDFDSRYLPEDYDVDYLKSTNGLFGETPNEKYTLDWLEAKPFTVCFCPGNHENYDRLYRAYPRTKWYGGYVRKLRKNVVMLENGERFDIDGFTVLSLGGARSYDISDGIIDPITYSSRQDLNRKLNEMWIAGKSFRINHISWWKEEIPSLTQINKFVENSAEFTDLILTHEAPTILTGYPPKNMLGQVLNEVHDSAGYEYWVAGHHHVDRYLGDSMILYNNITRLA